jgi:hypothetical protein
MASILFLISVIDKLPEILAIDKLPEILAIGKLPEILAIGKVPEPSVITSAAFGRLSPHIYPSPHILTA